VAGCSPVDGPILASHGIGRCTNDHCYVLGRGLGKRVLEAHSVAHPACDHIVVFLGEIYGARVESQSGDSSL